MEVASTPSTWRRSAQVCGELFYYLAHSGFSQWQRPKIPHQSLERVLEPFHLEDEVVFRFPGRVKPEHAKVIRVRKDRDTGERMYDVRSSEFQTNLNVPRVSPGGRGGVATESIPPRSSPKTKNNA